MEYRSQTGGTAGPISAGVRIGHVHLKVADLDRALAFYGGVLGFEVTQRYGRQAAFLSAGGYHHHIGLNTWESAGGSPPPPGATGLFHLAILYPTRAALADVLHRLESAGVPLEGASDHGVSEALNLRDPDRMTRTGCEECCPIPNGRYASAPKVSRPLGALKHAIIAETRECSSSLLAGGCSRSTGRDHADRP